jgi:hypothetical protein
MDATRLTWYVNLLLHPDVDGNSCRLFVELMCAVLGCDCTNDIVIGPLHRLWSKNVRYELAKNFFRSQ